MARLTKYTAFLAPALALVALGGCAENFNANVARFQQLPAPIAKPRRESNERGSQRLWR